MKSFLYKFITIAAIVIIIDTVFGYYLKKLASNLPDAGILRTDFYKATTKATSNILILGNSRACHHYDTKIISDSLLFSVYNAGIDGTDVKCPAMILKSYLKRCTPKIVILDLNRFSLENTNIRAYKDFNCFYDVIPEVTESLNDLYSWKEKIKLLSNLYRFSNSISWLYSAFHNKNPYPSGYIPIEVKATNAAIVVDTVSFEPAAQNINYLNNIILTCQKNNIKLYILYSPSLIISKGKRTIQSWLKSYSTKNNVSFIDYNGNNNYISHTEWFKDSEHMNKNGAEIFTKELIRRIK